MKKLLRWVTIIMTVNLLLAVYIPCLCASLLVTSESLSQSVKDVNISIDVRETSVENALEIIEQQTRFRFVYSGNALSFVKNSQISLEATNKSVADVLGVIANKTKASFRQVDNNIVVTAPSTIPDKKKEKSSKQAKQDQLIRGKITDSSGEPLAGANIIVKATTIGTVTDVDGNYTISAPDNATVLVYSYIGYSTQEIEIAGRSVIDVTLQEDITSLSGVTVSTGYWQTSEKLNPGNISKINSEDIAKQPVSNPLQTIQGRMPGVNVIQNTGLPGGGMNIQIRGLNSLRTGNTDNGNFPLYIIDGVPYPSQPVLTTLLSSVIQQGNPLNSINPSDIESIQVLKDADATAIYGSRGANGVVLITTKKGAPGKTKFDVNFSQGAGKVANRMDLLDTQQYLEMRNEAFGNDGATPDPFNPNDLDVLEWGDGYTDWQEELIGETAHMTNAELSMSGGNANTQFSIGVGFKRETTPIPGDFSYEKGSGRFSLGHSTLDRKFNIALTTTYTTDKNDLANNDPTRLAITLAPNAPPLRNEDGSLNWDSPLGQPLARLLTNYVIRTSNLITSADLNYKPVPFLNIKARLGFNRLSFDETRTRPIESNNPAFGVTSGSADFTDGGTNSWIVEPQIEYNKEIAQGQLSVLVGTTFQETISERETMRATGFQDDSSLENIAGASTLNNLEYIYSEYRYSAVYGRINYNWKEKYIVNLSGRRDGSSRFGPDKRFGNFGAVGIAWIFSNEAFVKNNLPFISFGKFRGSYGLTGNDQILDYEFLNSYDYTGDSYLGVPGIQPARIANPEYSWETNRKLEAGLELGFYNDKVLVSVSYYRNRSSNQLVGFDLPGTTGFLGVRDNLPAEVENTGWEFELTTINIENNNFKWTTSVNFTAPRNELIAYPNIENSPFATRFRVGSSLFVRGAFEASVDPQTGLYTYRDVNDDGFAPSFSDDLLFDQEIGPEFFGGFQNTFRYKGFELDIFFQFVKQTANSYIFNFRPPGWHGNQPTAVLDRWQNPGDITDVQMFTQGFTDAVFAWFNVGDSDLNIVDASFVRLKNVSLSWNLPEELNGKLKLERSKIYLQGQNLLTFTDYVGLDPESFGTSVPPLRMIAAGIQVTF
ncbi:MAG: TonB-dependent receptor [Cytophagales bacterium]|nr:TonB-dependent receptor [Cytophagales bacterium]